MALHTIPVYPSGNWTSVLSHSFHHKECLGVLIFVTLFWRRQDFEGSWWLKLEHRLFQYSVQDVTFPQTLTTADLLVLFGDQLTFAPHVNFIKLQALCYVGTVCGWREFWVARSFMKLHSTVWHPFCNMPRLSGMIHVSFLIL